MKKISLSVLILLAALLTACRPADAERPTNTPADIETAVPNPTDSEPPTDTPSLPNSTAMSIDWDDRSIYESGLLPDAQGVLLDYPGASVYHITLNIPDNLPAPIDGSVAVRYTNVETVPLEEVYFRLFSPVYSGGMDVSDVQVNGEAAVTTLESYETALRIELPEALAVGDRVEIAMQYTLELPATLEGSYGLLGYFGDTLTLDTFYPMIPAYDEDYGWYSHTPYPNGDLTYQDMSFYIVDVQAPEDLVLAASGVEIDRATSGGTQQVTYAAGPARDFYIAGSSEFTMMSKEVDGVIYNSYAKPGQESGQAIAMNTAANVAALFNDLLGEYPYTEFDVVNAPMLAYGIEYPGITNIYDDLYRIAMQEDPTGASLTTLETVVAHEMAHQWFYNMVGNDQQEHPWLDEAVAQYITYLYVQDQHGEATAQAANVANWHFRLGRVTDNEMAIGLPSGEYQGYEYSGIVYGRGPLFFLELEETYGQQTVIDGLRDYFQSNLWEIGNEAELRASLEDACGCDLSEQFEQWIDN